MRILKATLMIGALVFSVSSFAQDRQTVIFSGDLDSEAVSAPGVETNYPGASTYEVYIEFDTSATLVNDTGTSKTYANAVTAIDILFYDAEGALISGPDFSYDMDTMGTSVQPNVNFSSSETDSLNFDVTLAQTNLDIWVNYSGPAGSLYSDFSGFPVFAEGETTANSDLLHVGYLSDGGFTWDPHFDIYGPLSTIAYDDSDGDGISDLTDSCSSTITDETVAFDGWYDSGVPNYVDDSGCSIMDYYAACEAAEQEAPVRGIRSVRSGPSNCEKAVSYDLVADGVISYAEARMLRNALYESSTSSGPQ